VYLKQFNLKFFLAFFTVLAALVVQGVAQSPGSDATSYLTSDVIRVGGKLACRCGGCRNTVGDCPMLRCSSADPLRHRIHSLKQKGLSDSAIVNEIVREQGIVALASPPGEGLGPIVTWVMPGVALVIGFLIYSAFVRRNRKPSEPLTETDRSLIERYQGQIDRELDEDGRSGPLSIRR
jgi:cytochrome c-type biogenesis protein CcmH/NrfF